MTVLLHRYYVERGEAVFGLVFEGDPVFEVETARIPLSLFPDGFGSAGLVDLLADGFTPPGSQDAQQDPP
jgi:hypothetical protein